MVLLARNLALDPDLPNPRIVLVTDRDDLTGNWAIPCGLRSRCQPWATSGRNLLELVAEKAGIITTLIHKFDKAYTARKYQMNRQTSSFWSTRGTARNSAHSLRACGRCSECLLSGLYRHTTLEKRKTTSRNSVNCSNRIIRLPRPLPTVLSCHCFTKAGMWK